MQSGATNFANCIQTAQTGRAVDVGLNPAALIMRCRHHWNRLLCHVDPKMQTGLVNIWEPLAQKFHRLVGDVEKHILRAGAFDLSVNRTGNNVPRRQRTTQIVAFHEVFAAIVPQAAAFASHRFRNQKRFRFGIKQTGRMKLNKLHVRNRHSGAPGYRHAVTGRDIWIRCVEINFSATTGREHDSVRTDCLHLAAIFIKDVNAEATVLRRVTDLGGRD